MFVSDYELISIDDLALLPRKASLSETSSNGIASHDSGHDSYLDDGKRLTIITIHFADFYCKTLHTNSTASNLSRTADFECSKYTWA